MKTKMQLNPKAAPSVKVSARFIYITAGIVITTLIGIVLFIQLNLGNPFKSLGASGTFTSKGSGNWTTNTVWQAGVAPSTDLDGDNITIRNNHSVFRNGNITGDNNVTLTVQANATLTINGDFTIKNNLVLNNSGTIIITGRLIAKNNSLVTINGGGTMKVDKDIAFENNTNFTVNGNLTAGEDVTFGNNALFQGSGTVKIAGSGCSNWTGSTACQFGVTLPVKLLSFKAQDNGDGTVKITWSTAAEKNNDYFTIQRSNDGITFNELATAKGKGTTKDVSYYDLYDTQPSTERLYYRLVQTDFDGTKEVFEPVFVEVKLESGEISAYPNPIIGRKLTVNLPKAEAGSLQIVDYRGKTILNKALDGSSAVVDLEFDNELPQGFYYINYKSNSGFVKSLKIVKK